MHYNGCILTMLYLSTDATDTFFDQVSDHHRTEEPLEQYGNSTDGSTVDVTISHTITATTSSNSKIQSFYTWYKACMSTSQPEPKQTCYRDTYEYLQHTLFPFDTVATLSSSELSKILPFDYIPKPKSV